MLASSLSSRYGDAWISAASAVILGALPTDVLVFALAQQYDVYVQRSTAAIMGSTVVSVVTLSVLFALLGVA